MRIYQECNGPADSGSPSRLFLGFCTYSCCDMLYSIAHHHQPTPPRTSPGLCLFRFSPDMHLPGDIIIKLLNLETECYEPHCPPAHEEFPKPFMFNYTAPLSRVVDPGACGCLASHPTSAVLSIGRMLRVNTRGLHREQGRITGPHRPPPICPVSPIDPSVTRMPSGYATAIRMLAKRAQDAGAKVGCCCC